MGFEILLYVPNIIGYIRILLIATSISFYWQPPVFLTLYILSVLLDGLDGYAARQLNQISAFGAWFDVVIDICGRGYLWCVLYDWGYLVAALEWIVFVCTHTQGAEWKKSYIQAPWFVSMVMANNFKTPMGAYVITGLHFLPVWLYAYYTNFLTSGLGLPVWVQFSGICMLSSARAVCMFVEMWCVLAHIRYLLSDEANREFSIKNTTNGSLKSGGTTR
ncbi:unnamed protein product [Owenia fusiformis]|uniref:CDP-diacylglycerol--inositol 3-phosphatidyltransferase n=1 Tax=Owenia fusiformis TaxID=6347 RepID=A0A8S4Q3L3_OWEFU|nr:unnamed protein product [Owenia fusiformis]